MLLTTLVLFQLYFTVVHWGSKLKVLDTLRIRDWQQHSASCDCDGWLLLCCETHCFLGVRALDAMLSEVNGDAALLSVMSGGGHDTINCYVCDTWYRRI